MDKTPFECRSAISFLAFHNLFVFQLDFTWPSSPPCASMNQSASCFFFLLAVFVIRQQCVSSSVIRVVQNSCFLFFKFVIHFLCYLSVKNIQKSDEIDMEQLCTSFIVSFSLVAPTLNSLLVWYAMCISLTLKAWSETCNKLSLSMLSSLCYAWKLSLTCFCLQFWKTLKAWFRAWILILAYYLKVSS